jgi:CTP synthase
LISFPWNPSFKELWYDLVNKIESAKEEVVIAVVGKYTQQTDAYFSLINAIKHACIDNNCKLRLLMIDSSSLVNDDLAISPTSNADKNEAWRRLESADGVIVPGGFGERGVEGMIAACQYVREKKVPFLGICLGLQVAVIEYTRNLLHRTAANSEEFDKTLTGLFSFYLCVANTR